MDIPAPQIERIDEWLFSTVDDILIDVVAQSVSNLTEVIYEPLTLFVTISLMLYAYAVMRGLIQEPISDFFWRATKISIVSSIVFTGGVYAKDIVEILISLPNDLSAAVLGQQGLNNIISDMLNEITKVSKSSFEKIDFWSDIPLSLLLVASVVIMTLCASFLAVVSSLVLIVVKVSMALLACVGPIFIACAVFDYSKGLFDKWVSQCINYTMLGLLFTLLFQVVMKLNLTLVRASVGWIDGGNVQVTAIIFAYIFVFGASIYIFLQLPTIASALSGGFGLQFASPTSMIKNAFKSKK
ncbi:type IV secretion system protein [Castellaniella sp.]|uniref:type IV secretion system protein n=1 Tax=Castellaniella sp. TaxID=1955812 RepID=UPI002AFEAE29|nr:type IV secretion system protein [Castellaniella sp.]